MFKVVEKNIGSFQSSYFHFLVCRFLDNLVHDDLASLVVLLTWPCQFLSTFLPLFLSTSLLSCSDSLFLAVISPTFFLFPMKHLPYFFLDYWDNQHVSLGVISIFTLYRLSFSAAVSECRFMPIEQFVGYIMV
jgi:hypothetical protein